MVWALLGFAPMGEGRMRSTHSSRIGSSTASSHPIAMNVAAMIAIAMCMLGAP
jgi:hypothetical protein